MRALNIEQVDGQSATDEELSALNDLNVEVERESLPDDPPRPAEEFIAWTRSHPSYWHSTWWMVRDSDGRAVAGSNVEWQDKEENRHLAELSVEVRPSERGRGLAKVLLPPAIEKIKALGRTEIHSWVLAGSKHESFAARFGAEFTLKDYHNRLFLDELDRSMLDGWIERATERASDYSLVFWDGLTPDEDLEEFAELMHIMNTAPRPEGYNPEKFTPETVREREERLDACGFITWRLLARHNGTGEIAGYTAMFPNRWRPEFAEQEDTGVLTKHQNRGLGRWLKAAMLVKLLEERPNTRWVDTWNATTNRPMLSINNALGFRPVEVWGTWRVPTQTLEAKAHRLSQKRSQNAGLGTTARH